MLKAVLFDLDGTLVDSADELALGLNRTLEWLGRPPVENAQVRGWIGEGARALLGKALGAPADDAAWRCFVYEYGEAIGSASRTYADTGAMLERLQSRGLKLALLTNKEQRLAHRLLAAHGLTPYFDLIVAGDTLPVKKPDPRVVQHALDALEVSPDEVALVGDSVLDVRTARAAGIRAWIVRHGYPAGEFSGADAPDAVIARFADFDPGFADDAATIW